MVYGPAGVPAGTDTTPSAGFILGTGLPACKGVAGVLTTTVAFTVVAGKPLIVSPVKALPAFGFPVAPFTPTIVSLVATIGVGSTVTVIVASLQFDGATPAFNFSHNL